MIALQLTVISLNKTIYENRNPVISWESDEFLDKTFIVKVIWVEFILVSVVGHEFLKGIC
jgi:hypothetical protein